MDDRLERLIRGLELAGVKKYGRNKIVSDKTGYSPSSVAKTLQGSVPLSEKFLTTICDAFGIDDHWVRTGDVPTLLTARGLYDGEMKPDRKPLSLPVLDKDIFMAALGKITLAPEKLKEAVEDYTISRIILEVLEMSKADRHRALALLIEMNEKKGGT